MTKICIAISWFLLIGMIGSFSVIYLFDSRTARQEKTELSESLRNTLHSYEQKLEFNSSQLEAKLRDIQSGHDVLRAEFTKLANALSTSDNIAPTREAVETAEAAAPPLPEESDFELLPPVPDGVDIEQFVKKEGLDLKAIVQDSRYNPSGKEPTRVEKLQMLAELKRASALREVIDSDVRVAVAQGVEKLRARGDYIDYARGEKYQQAPGLLSAGEPTEDGGVRIFYLHSEDFPEIYAKKKERKALAERAVRKVLSYLQQSTVSGN